MHLLYFTIVLKTIRITFNILGWCSNHDYFDVDTQPKLVIKLVEASFL